MASPVKAKEPKSVLHDIFAWSIGSPTDLAKDIADTKTLLEMIRARHKAAAKATP